MHYVIRNIFEYSIHHVDGFVGWNKECVGEMVLQLRNYLIRNLPLLEYNVFEQNILSGKERFTFFTGNSLDS